MLSYLLFLWLLTWYRRVSQEHGIVKQANDGALKEEMTRRERLQNEIQWLARHDELTQSPIARHSLEQGRILNGRCH